MVRKKKSRKAGATSGAMPSGLRRFRAPLILVAVLVAGALGGALLFASLSSDGGPSQKTAVIVDQVSLTNPNPDFVSKATALLKQAGYTVDYYGGEQVTVDLYRDLPKRGYNLIVLRVHSSIATINGKDTGWVSLFSGEPYSLAKYHSEQAADYLGSAEYNLGDAPLFAIEPSFVRSSMEGNFNGALIVMMGCVGLRTPTAAEAFLAKGASAFVGWNASVTPQRTDEATERLLENLFVNGMKVEDAVSATAAEVGPDPVFQSELRVVTN